MSRYSLIALCVLANAAYAGSPDIRKVNGSLVVEAGQSVGNVATVNGAIQVGDKASIGSANTVNGHITLGNGTTAQSVRTVNGAIWVGSGAHVDGEVRTTNGAISIGPEAHLSGTVTAENGSIVLRSSADISGHVATVNGRIRLDAAHVGKGIETYSGGIDLEEHSRVEGGIWVRNSRNSAWNACTSEILSEILKSLSVNACEPPLIVIGPDVAVRGTLKFDHPVRLYVSTSARIGLVEGAQAILFSGARPPI